MIILSTVVSNLGGTVETGKTTLKTNSKTKIAAWVSFQNIVKSFILGIKKVGNYVELLSDRFENYKKLACNVSLKIHITFSFGCSLQYGYGRL